MTRFLPLTRLVLNGRVRSLSQSAPKLELRPLVKEHAGSVRSLLLKSFFLHEPLNIRFGYNLPNEVEDFIAYVVKGVVDDRCSFVYLDQDRLAAMILNTIKSKDDPDKSVEFRSATLRFIYTMIGSLQDKQTVFDYLQTDRVLYTGIVSVDSDYRGLRLSEKLLQKSLDTAKDQLNIRGAFAETTSLYSLKAFVKMGYKPINEIMYEKYDKANLSNMGIHDRCSLVVRKI